MSLGIPDFRPSAGASGDEPATARVLRLSGTLAFVLSLLFSAYGFYRGLVADRSFAQSRAEVTQRNEVAQAERRGILRNGDLLSAIASVESSPARVRSDLERVLPGGVSLTLLKVDYGTDGQARVEASVVARSPEAYDRFLAALSRSASFAEIRPGTESRPGLIRATVLATHRVVVASP